jgi:WD40 repeat protein
MNEDRLRERLHRETIPGERESEQRAWDVVRAAYEQREAVPPRGSRSRPLVLALAGAALLLAALLSPAGAAVRDWVKDVVEPGKERAAPALTRLPAPGYLLVESEQGPWIVNEDGSSRLVGSFDEATWSPSGMFVGVADGGQLSAVVGPSAVETTGQSVGTVRWSLPPSRRIAGIAWAPSGYRIAYLSGDELRVVVGDGSHDLSVADRVVSVTPAWKPLSPSERQALIKTGGIGTHVVAYVDEQRRVRVVDTDSGHERWQSEPFDAPIRSIGWSPDGQTLFVLTDDALTVLVDRLDGEPVGGTHGFVPWSAVAAAASPRSDEIAVVLQRTSASGTVRSRLALLRGESQRVLYANPGRFTDVAWSPNGRWLLVAWEDEDQWLFINPRSGKPDAVGGISKQFAPGESGGAAFPRIAGWCCERSP